MIKKGIFYLFLILISLVVGDKIGSTKNLETEVVKEEIEQKSDRWDRPLPQCWSINCPEIEAMDVDGDSEYETVIIEYPTMTQQAGRAWIIKDGELLFKSDVLAQISVLPKANGLPNNGFEILYNTEGKMSEDFEKGWQTDLYLWNGEKFVLDETKNIEMN